MPTHSDPAESTVATATPVDDILQGGIDGSSGAVAPALESAPLAAVIELVRSGRATTRPQLVTVSGLGRRIVSQRVEQALELGLLQEGELARSEGGRQARSLKFNSQAGHVYAALVGASEMTVAVADLDGRLTDSIHEDWSVESGPAATMERLREHFTTLARRTGVHRPWGIGIGVPGPVDFASGRLAAPPIMPGWDGFSVRAWLRDHYDAPVWVDNDVNLMALGEWTQGQNNDRRDMLFIKVGTGVGAGLIVHGRLVRGERGGAGDIGHTHVTDDPTKACRCGKTGCLEAVAGGSSLLMEATDRSNESPALQKAIDSKGRLTLGDIGNAARNGDPLALQLIDQRARAIAEVAANLVNFCNPKWLVIGGGVLRTGTRFLEVLEAKVLERCTDLVADSLEIRPASLDHLEGVIGAALLGAESLLHPATLTRWVEDGSPLGHAAALQRHAAAFN
ncbi:ROK family protein [Paenarthrobacter aurescens]|uniref:ROK family protein n=1 Tax=Paenarthrobacter aurescens TaxID=43663 RepID=UPI0021BF1BC9|nr:ROK family protein [Paenarthrobacter aurescens]MCT9868306.1 ROK family protein [Paenarthrobacter aurescens]